MLESVGARASRVVMSVLHFGVPAMNCPTCRQENREAAKFCVRCGRSLSVPCASCGAELPAGARFCDACGAPVIQAAEAPAIDRTPRGYTPKHLAEKILSSKSALEGERKQVTVLFADVKGSLDLAEQVDPEEWHRILNRFFEILSDGVHRFEGTVNQYTGDGIMALFGAPIAHEDHAQRACYAALYLRETLRRYAEELRRERGLNFSARMGLNSGEVVVGKIGDDLRMDYTAQGHTVGLASRVEQLAEPGAVYLTEGTAKLVFGFFRLRDIGPFQLRGVREPTRVYDLQGVGPMRSRLDVARSRGLTRFVGRDKEMEVLEANLASALEGKGQVIGVVAEAGIGKSRLCFEFLERCKARGILTRRTHCVAHGKSIPLLPVLNLLRDYFDLTERDSDQIAREKITGRLLLLDKAFEESLPLLFEFFGVQDPNVPALEMDPEARQKQLFEVAKQMARARSEREPAAMLFEDLHWIDGASDAFLETIVEVVPETRTLLLVNFRPGYRSRWTKKSSYQQISLLPLARQEIEELLRDLLGTDPSLEGLADHIRERTGGNPFFIEEVVQALVEGGSLEGTKGGYRLVRPVGGIKIPGTVQAVLAARIDRLGQEEKSLLQTAAIIGKEFTEEVLKRIADLSGAGLAAAIQALKEAEFIYEESLYPEVEYSFKHPLSQEVAYHSQLSERRAKMHRAVARAIAELYPDKLNERAALLAHHWEQAGDNLEAAGWSRRAAEWATGSDPAEALRHWRKVRTFLETVPESKETVELAMTACIQNLRLGWRLGLSEEEAADLFEEGKALASRSGDNRSLALLHSMYGQVRGMAGDLRAFIHHVETVKPLVDQIEDATSKLNLRSFEIYALAMIGRWREALTLTEQSLAWVRKEPVLDRELQRAGSYLLMRKGHILGEMGRIQDAAREFQHAEQLARKHGHVELLFWTIVGHSSLGTIKGDVPSALGYARPALELAEKLGNPISRVHACVVLGDAYLAAKDWGEAAEVLERGLEIARPTRTGLMLEAWMVASLAEAHLGLGKEELARVKAGEAIAIACRQGSRWLECYARFVLARILLESEGAKSKDRIEALLARALSLAEETGYGRHTPHIHEVLAALGRLLGDDVARGRELREAHRLYTEMGATGHAARLAKELRI